MLVMSPGESMSGPVHVEDVQAIELKNQFQPLDPALVTEGQPGSRSKTLSVSRDRLSDVILWECTAGHFNWHFNRDEVIFALSGKAFIIDADGSERCMAAGDVVFFPAGTSCSFRVDDHFRKVAVLRETMTRHEGYALKLWKKVVRLAFPFSAAPATAKIRTADVPSTPIRITPSSTSLR
jgi:uncharacterized cupin superfamily protein